MLSASGVYDDYAENSCEFQETMQRKINQANNIAEKMKNRESAVKLINETLEKNDQERFYEALMNPALGLDDYVDKFSVPLYYSEMKIDRAESMGDMSYNDIVVSLRVLSAIACVTKAVDTGDPDLVYQALSEPEAHITDLDQGNKVKYSRALIAIRTENKQTSGKCPLLTYMDIQECIDVVNQQCHEDNELIQILRLLNKSVLEHSRSGVMSALMNESLKLIPSASSADASLYMKLFEKCLKEKHSDGSELWLEDVENIVRFVTDEVEQVKIACELLVRINSGLKNNDIHSTIACLEESGLTILPKDRNEYFTLLKNLSDYKRSKYQCPYVLYVTPGGNESYMNLDQYSYAWDCPCDISDSLYVTKEDIENVIKHIELRETDQDNGIIDEKAIVKFQAHIRGYLCRKRIAERFTHFYNNIDKIVKVQAWWRGAVQRRNYARMLEARLKENFKRGRSYVRMTGKFKNNFELYREHEDKIIKLQALWRGRIARRAFHSLLRLEKPPFPVVRHFSAILNFNAEDYDRDLQLQQLKNDVVQTIRHNQDLSQQLDSMDIKIGLLIQNRITLQDVIAHGKNLESLAKDKSANRSRKNSTSDNVGLKGLKSLTKDGRKMLEGYQHLFYALQTNPMYLSKLLFLLPQGKSNKFLQNVILTLFNFGSNIREEYLLLKLFGRALQEEIRSKFQKPSEVVTETPLVLKMAVNYARQLHGQRALRQILGPLIERILADKSISIETSPVDIYKGWRNQLEMETGETV